MNISVIFSFFAAYLSVLSPRLLTFLFNQSIDSSAEGFIQLNNPYQWASVIGGICMIFILSQNKELVESRMRNLRRMLFGLLSILTLVSFSMLSFSAYPENVKGIPYIDKSSAFHLTTFLICSESFIALLIFKLESLFEIDQSLRNGTGQPKFESQKTELELKTILPAYEDPLDFSLNMEPAFEFQTYIPSCKEFVEDTKARMEKGKYQKRAEEVINASKSILINLTVSMLPFVMDLFFNFSLVDQVPLGKVVGLNDLYLIPAAFGAVEGSLQLSSNDEHKTELSRFIRRGIIGSIGLVSLVAFSLFAFGCNANAYSQINETYTYAIAGILSFAIAFLAISLNYLTIREIK